MITWLKRLWKNLRTIGTPQVIDLPSVWFEEESDFSIVDWVDEFLEDWQEENYDLNEEEVKEFTRLVQVFELRGEDDEEIQQSELSFILDEFLEEFGLGRYEY